MLQTPFFMATKTKAPEKTTALSASFQKTIAKLGIHPSEVMNGQVVRKPILINSVAEFKDIFQPDNCAATKAEYLNHLKNTQPEAFKDQAERHLQVRLGAHIYGGHPLSLADQQLATKVFPVKVMAEVAKTATISTPLHYGPNGSPVSLFFDTVTFSEKGSITVEHTIFSLKANKIIVGNISSGKPYLINILGLTGNKGADGDAGKSYTDHAKNGKNASRPSPGICTGSRAPGNGHAGANGGDASTNGNTGNNGLPSLQANITIADSLVGALSIYTKSGDGGAGGNGGAGGKGQDGGKGGDGCHTGCECTDAANGGNGGNGGNGSTGGNGGNGINGNDIFISVPSAYVSQIVKGSDQATPGLGGSGGASGRAGSGGGEGTTGTKHCSNGRPGQGGMDGKIGEAGKAGTQNGAPGNFRIN